MRRKIFYKNASVSAGHDLSSTDFQEVSLKSYKNTISESETHDDFLMKTLDSNGFHTNKNNLFLYKSPIRSHLMNFEHKLPFSLINRKKPKITIKLNHNFKRTDKSRKPNLEILNSNIQDKNIRLSINGRPLTAVSNYKDQKENRVKRPQSLTKKRDSMFSYGDSDEASPLDPKFFDEEYTNLEEYSQLLLSQPIKYLSKSNKSPNHVGTNFKGTNVKLDDKDFKIFEESRPKTPVSNYKADQFVEIPAISLIVTSAMGKNCKNRGVCKPKGRLVKGPCNKSFVPSKSKVVRNIKIS